MMVTEYWTEYTFKDGTTSYHPGYNENDLKLQVIHHGKILRERKVKIIRNRRGYVKKTVLQGED